MALANLDIDLLRSFAAVADSGGFTAAASLVARTQSAVPKTLAWKISCICCGVVSATGRKMP